jgi:hypothetical protein
MHRRVLLCALAAAFLMPFGERAAEAQPAAQPGGRQALDQQKRAMRRLRKTDKKWFKRRKRKAKQMIKREEVGPVRVYR